MISSVILEDYTILSIFALVFCFTQIFFQTTCYVLKVLVSLCVIMCSFSLLIVEIMSIISQIYFEIHISIEVGDSLSLLSSFMQYDLGTHISSIIVVLEQFIIRNDHATYIDDHENKYIHGNVMRKLEFGEKDPGKMAFYFPRGRGLLSF